MLLLFGFFILNFINLYLYFLEMMTEEIEITTTKELFFLEYLTLKKPVLNAILSKLNKRKVVLTDIPIQVFAQLLYYNDYFKDMKEKEKWNMIFGAMIKRKIYEGLNLKEHHLNIYLSQLRKIGILSKRTINKPFIIYSNDIHLLSFKFKVNGHGE